MPKWRAFKIRGRLRKQKSGVGAEGCAAKVHLYKGSRTCHSENTVREKKSLMIKRGELAIGRIHRNGRKEGKNLKEETTAEQLMLEKNKKTVKREAPYHERTVSSGEGGGTNL